MAENKPQVSIGLPIYNAGAQTRRILDSLTAQDYPHLEIIISDNASTDETGLICQEYASRDRRIRLYRNATNCGIVANFERVLQLSSGDYFMWAAHDDRWDPGFVSACVHKLEAHPEALLCYTDQIHTAVRTGEQKPVRFAALELSGSDAAVRVRRLLNFRPQTHPIIYGLFRRQAAAAALPLARVPDTDMLFLFRVLLHGPAVHVPAFLYERSVKGGRTLRASMQQTRLTDDLPPNFILLLQMLAVYLKITWRSSESLWNKARITAVVTGHTFWAHRRHFVPPPLLPLARFIKRWTARQPS